jgi:hypothetical protein
MRSETNVELPKLRRARNGRHVIYGAYEDSVCYEHQFCSYTGDETDRCSTCHSSYHDTEDHGEIPPHWLAACLCSKCGELFSAVTGFNQHRSKGKCRNPARRGLVLVDKKDRYGQVWSVWARPGSRPEDV